MYQNWILVNVQMTLFKNCLTGCLSFDVFVDGTLPSACLRKHKENDGHL